MKKRVAVAALVLGTVERFVGIAHQVLPVGGILRKQRNSARQPHGDLLGADVDRLFQRLEQAVGQFFGVGRARDFGLQDGEFIAAKAGQTVTRAQDGVDAGGDADDDRVARIMAEQVVDLAETVHVQIEQGEMATTARGTGKFLVQQLGEKEAVGQAR